MAVLDFRGKKTIVLNKNLKALQDENVKIVVNRGGTRSSKTHSNLQIWAGLSFDEQDERILITRKTLPALKLSAYADFKKILKDYNIEDRFHHNKSDLFFKNKQSGTEIHFISSDNPQKIRGVEWTYAQLTEGNELNFEDFRQIIMRLKKKMFIDFNPSEADIWINNEIEQKRKDIEVIISSYKDNQFLTQTIIDEIEYLRDQDPMYWHIFGLGEYGNLKNKIYNNIRVIQDHVYDSLPFGTETFYGLDFGDVHATVLQECKYHEDEVYVDEKFYAKGKYDEDLITFMKEAGISEADDIHADHAASSSIRKLRAEGFLVHNANKDVRDGLRFCRNLKRINITQRSVNTIREVNKYKYKERPDGTIVEEPVKFDDDCMDAMRYGLFSHLRRRIHTLGVS